ncbi:hypothetical protein WUBG_07451, partial [Wuchereria bancrofti]
MVDPMEQIVDEGESSQIRCFIFDNKTNVILKWRKQNNELPIHATQKNGILYISQTEINDAGNYICTMDDFRGTPIDSLPARINVRQ